MLKHHGFFRYLLKNETVMSVSPKDTNSSDVSFNKE